MLKKINLFELATSNNNSCMFCCLVLKCEIENFLIYYVLGGVQVIIQTKVGGRGDHKPVEFYIKYPFFFKLKTVFLKFLSTLLGPFFWFLQMLQIMETIMPHPDTRKIKKIK